MIILKYKTLFLATGYSNLIVGDPGNNPFHFFLRVERTQDRTMFYLRPRGK